MAVAWHCPACNPSKASAGLRFASLDDADHFPVCECRVHMEPTDPANTLAYWREQGRWFGDAEAMIEYINLPDECARVDKPSSLPPEGHPYREAWEQGRLQGYRDGYRGEPIHPDGWTMIRPSKKE